jgi:hypothetical protein
MGRLGEETPDVVLPNGLTVDGDVYGIVKTLLGSGHKVEAGNGWVTVDPPASPIVEALLEGSFVEVALVVRALEAR